MRSKYSSFLANTYSSWVSVVTGRGEVVAHQTVRLPLHFPNYAEGSVADDVQRFVEVQQRRHVVRSRGGGYLVSGWTSHWRKSAMQGEVAGR